MQIVHEYFIALDQFPVLEISQFEQRIGDCLLRQVGIQAANALVKHRVIQRAFEIALYIGPVDDLIVHVAKQFHDGLLIVSFVIKRGHDESSCFLYNLCFAREGMFFAYSTAALWYSSSNILSK